MSLRPKTICDKLARTGSTDQITRKTLAFTQALISTKKGCGAAVPVPAGHVAAGPGSAADGHDLLGDPLVGLPGSGERLGMLPGVAHQVLAARYGTDRIKTKGRGRA